MMREPVFQAVVQRQAKNFLNRLVTLVSAAALRPITNQNEGSSAESTTKEPDSASGWLYQGQAILHVSALAVDRPGVPALRLTSFAVAIHPGASRPQHLHR